MRLTLCCSDPVFRTYIISTTDHWQDALTGSALGLGIAYASYRQYYPRLTSKMAHIPFKTRFEQVEEEYDLDSGDAVNDEEAIRLIEAGNL